MNRIKCLVAAFALGSGLISCQQSKTPTSVASEFVHELYGLDFTEAGKLASSGSAEALQRARQSVEGTGNLDEERNRRVNTPAETVFETAAFTEQASGDAATVRNGQLTVSLRKEGGDWKVVADPALVDALVNHPLYRDAAQAAWERLQQEYEKRNNTAREYITMRSSKGEHSKALSELDAAVRESMNGKTGSGIERLDFLRRQDRLQAYIDRGIEPAMNAAADFSLNYIVQLSDARRRIEEARKAYAEAALKARDRQFPPLP